MMYSYFNKILKEMMDEMIHNYDDHLACPCKPLLLIPCTNCDRSGCELCWEEPIGMVKVDNLNQLVPVLILHQLNPGFDAFVSMPSSERN